MVKIKEIKPKKEEEDKKIREIKESDSSDEFQSEDFQDNFSSDFNNSNSQRHHFKLESDELTPVSLEESLGIFRDKFPERQEKKQEQNDKEKLYSDAKQSYDQSESERTQQEHFDRNRIIPTERRVLFNETIALNPFENLRQVERVRHNLEHEEHDDDRKYDIGKIDTRQKMPWEQETNEKLKKYTSRR